MFEYAQMRLERIQSHSNSAQNMYLLSAKIQCGECGSIFTGYMSGKKTKNYRCGKNNKAKTAVQCKAKQISEQIIDELNAVDAQLTTEESKYEKIIAIKEMEKRCHERLQRMSYEDKHELLQTIVKRIIIKGDDVKLELRVPKSVQDEIDKSEHPYGGTEGTRTPDLHSDSVAF